jgi:hypothetical protein
MEPIDAQAVYTYYESNEVKADNDFKEKWCLVTGKVSKIGKDIMSTPYVTFDNTDGAFGVQCMFSDNGEIAKLADLIVGQSISIAGKCDGKMGYVIFRQCQIVGPDAPNVGGKVHVVLIGN